MDHQDSKFTVKCHGDSYISLCNSKGFSIHKIRDRIISSNPKESNLDIMIYSENRENIKIVELLYLNFSSMIALVEQTETKNILEIKNFKKKELLYRSQSYPSPILSCTSTANHLAICLQDYIYIYFFISYLPCEPLTTRQIDFRAMMDQYDKISIGANPTGILALGKIYYAYPYSLLTSGVIKICSLRNKKRISFITTFDEPISVMAFDSSENYIAIASQSGIMIRIFSCKCKDGQPLYRFFTFPNPRSAFPNIISSLRFSDNFNYFGCGSDRNKIHIFCLSPYKPTFSYEATLPKTELNCSMIIRSTNPLELFVVTNEGWLILYKEHTSFVKGRELKLSNQKQLCVPQLDNFAIARNETDGVIGWFFKTFWNSSLNLGCLE